MMRRVRSCGHPPLVPQCSAEWRRASPLFAATAVPLPLSTSRRFQSTRDKQRSQTGADPTTGSQMQMAESPDFTPQLEFSLNTLEHVSVPEISHDRRQRTDMEKEREMRTRFGTYGPGERLTKSSQQTRRDMLEEQQDVDGLPWEVRWRKSLIPTSEEIIQDIRDRFELYVQDPIEREQEWYLHWKDRGFKAQKDRMIWPQGYTDYLDHYDENGRRRVLPTDQRWSDTSWKHLADTRYKDRMWLIEGEERKAVHKSLQSEKALIEEEEQRQQEMGDVFHGLTSGVVDLDPDQTYQALAGSADPLEVAKTKMKITAYGAQEAMRKKPAELSEIDPISGFPKADMEPLPTGVTVEQAASIAAQAAIQGEMFEQKAEAARLQGLDPAISMMKSHHESAKRHGDRPGIRAQVEASIAQVKQLQAQQRQVEETGKTVNMLRAESAVAQVEGAVMVDNTSAASPPPRPGQTPAQNAPPAFQAVEEGFITVEKRPPMAEPDIPTEMYQVPLSKDLDTMPKWYKAALVETDPMIKRYDMVHDPLETKEVEKTEYYRPPVVREEDRITNDDAITGASSFDEVKIHKLKSLPELVDGYKPLPLFREVSKDGTLESAAETAKEVEDRLKYVDKDGKPLKKSERLRRERQERLRKEKLQYDADIMLPQLPWETDSVVDPYRGVEKTDAVDFNKENLEKTWKVYRTTFQQVMTEFGNLTQMTNEASCEKMLHDSMDRFRNGEVGEHPEIHELQEEVFRLIFEAHTKHFLADYYKYKGNRATESSAIKSEADEILRRASAKCKLLGQNFMNFIQEMTSLELDTIRKNPVQRYAVILRDKKFEPIAQPFMKWIKSELNEFHKNEFTSMEQIETHREFLVRHLNTARSKCPARVEGLSDAARDATVEGFYQWCRGALCFFGAKKLHEMYLHFADTRFRGKAEELFEDSYEWFSNYAKAGREVVQIPIPDCDPPYEYDEKEFLDGENAVLAEMSGLLDKAEGLWHGGSTKRWYPLIDETEYMWFNERRGRITLALDISDRCLENVNKKTHPSIHPFPERARVFLEGAPLTQETAEHLWLRYMGDLYWEHSLFMYRQGRYQMGRTYREKCLNFYHLAIRTARERLPPSWKAPLLTEAKYLLRVYEPGEDTARHLGEIDTVVAKLFEEKEPRHWLDPFTELPFRLAIVQANLPAYGEYITKEVIRRLGWQPPNELLMKNMEQRARGGDTLPELVKYFATVNEVADTVFRQKVLQWRAKEAEGSDPYLYWTHLYFTFRVFPKDSEEVQKLWDMYEPAFLYIYTQAALATRMRGMRLLNVTIRQMSQVLIAGNREQKKILLAELTKLREKLSHMVDHEEMDRAINTLDGHLSDPASVPYIYGTTLIYKDAQEQERIARNPLLRTQLGAKDYKELQERIQETRANSMTMNPQQAAKLQESQGSTLDEEAIGSQPDLSTKDMFN